MNLIDHINQKIERDSDGIIGLKVFDVHPEHGLRSPAQHTVWDGPTLSARKWSNEGAVRGEVGIHACWPWTPGELFSYISYDSCLVEVRGYGDTIQGTKGWRAEHCMLKAVHCLPPHLPFLAIGLDADFDSAKYSEIPICTDMDKWVKVIWSLDKTEYPFFERDWKRHVRYAQQFYNGR